MTKIEVGAKGKFTSGPYAPLHFTIVRKYTSSRQVEVRFYDGARFDVDLIDLIEWTVVDAPQLSGR